MTDIPTKGGKESVASHTLGELSWNEARDAFGAGAVALLPVGATEAHGPHLPLSTDVIIA